MSRISSLREGCLTESPMYQLIIIGAGPAGATLALAAAHHGLTTLLVDKARFPRDKSCGDVVPHASFPLLQQYGLAEEVQHIPHCQLHDTVICSDTETLRVANRPWAARREVFDHRLFQAARTRVETREGWIVEDLLFRDGHVCGIQGRTQEGEAFSCTASVVAGADGYGSIVARKMGAYARAWEHWGFGVRGYYRGVGGTGTSLEFHFFEEYFPGYLWIAPVDDERVNVGTAVFATNPREQGFTIGSRYREMLQTPRLKARFELAERVGTLQAWNMPLASMRRTLHGNGFVLVGDAAGLIDPLWGYGIDGAMVSGSIAAEVIAEACRSGDTRAEALQPYADTVWETLGERFARNHRAREQMASSPAMTGALQTLASYLT